MSCYQHRLLTTSQVHMLHFADCERRQALKVLHNLALAGNVALSRRRMADEAVWYATEKGAELAEMGDGDVRKYRVTAESAAGPLRQHTLEVNDVGVAFVAAARGRGDECNPGYWRHEQAFRVSDRPGSPMLMVDSVLHYTVNHPTHEELIVRFVELDRNTMSHQDVVDELKVYGQLYAYHPKAKRVAGQNPTRAGKGWRDRFAEFPKVLLVLSGADQPTLFRRRDTLLYLCAKDKTLDRGGVTITITTLAELVDEGPFERIFWSPHLAAPVDLVGDGPQPRPGAQPEADRPVRAEQPPLVAARHAKAPAAHSGQLQLIQPGAGGR
jgi:hypothetical protein